MQVIVNSAFICHLAYREHKILLVMCVPVCFDVFSYAVAFSALAVVRAWMIDQPVLSELAPITGPMYMLFMFFMITDPRTIVRDKRGRMLVVCVIALVEMGIRMLDQVHLPLLDPLLTAPPIFALFIVGPIAKALELRRQAKAPVEAVPAPA